MNLRIKDRIAVITGADSGIGLETAKFLARAGCHLVLSDKKEGEALKSAVDKVQLCNPEVKIRSFAANLSSNGAVLDLAKFVKNELGHAHIVFHSAGARGAADDFLKLSDEDWKETIEIDLMGAVRVARAFVPHLIANEWGRMILVSSENALQPYVEESPYNACKAAIINLSKCLSRAYSKENILFNVISPAFIETPMTDAMMEEEAEKRGVSMEEAEKQFVKENRPHLAMQRRGKPEEVASMVAFLCSEHASFINGSNIRIDGGAVESAFG